MRGTGGHTSISDGLAKGLQVLHGVFARAGVPKMLLLLTDGRQTVDGDDATAIAQAEAVKAAGVHVVAAGFGGADAATMKAIASAPASENAFLGGTVDDIQAHFADGKLCELPVESDECSEISTGVAAGSDSRLLSGWTKAWSDPASPSGSNNGGVTCVDHWASAGGWYDPSSGGGGGCWLGNQNKQPGGNPTRFGWQIQFTLSAELAKARRSARRTQLSPRVPHPPCTMHFTYST